MDEVKCPYCNSRDLSKLPSEEGATSVTYKCQMCSRTFNKSINNEEQK